MTGIDGKRSFKNASLLWAAGVKQVQKNKRQFLRSVSFSWRLCR